MLVQLHVLALMVPLKFGFTFTGVTHSKGTITKRIKKQ
jgi:hypothetical protein